MGTSSDRLKRALDGLIYLPSLRDSGHPDGSQGSDAPLSVPSPQAPERAAEPPRCRPWDREDLMRRLQTFRAATWFGKPGPLSPAACASRGWTNVGMDALKCEFCGARMICELPPGDTQGEQHQQLVSRYVQRLDEAHTACCPWKGQACSEWLLQFPSIDRDVLLRQYNARLEVLARVDGLPNIKQAALDRMLAAAKKGSAIAKALAAASALEAGASKAQRRSAVQRALAVCGWEVQVPGYSVSGGHGGGADAPAAAAGRSSPPCVSLTSPPGKGLSPRQPGGLALESVARPGPQLDSQGVVLCCSMCGARAGLWNYTGSNDAPRPLWQSVLVSRSAPGALEAPAASASPAAVGGAQPGARGGFAPPPHKQPAREVQLALTRTLGGGDLDALAETKGSASSSGGASAAARAVRIASTSPLVPVFGNATTQAPAFGSGSPAPAFGAPPVPAKSPQAPPPQTKRPRVEPPPQSAPATQAPPPAAPLAAASDLDPIALHRPFCPWVCSVPSGAKSGWVQVLDAAAAPPAGTAAGDPELALDEDNRAAGPPVDVYTKRFMSALFDA